MDLSEIVGKFKGLQDDICAGLSRLDPSIELHEDLWQMSKGSGGGRTRILQGQQIEKGGVNFSHVSGKVTDELRKILKKDGQQYDATGVSIVLHPTNPFVPIIHMNIRYFEMDETTWWFGGGIDLTPHYIDLEQASSFHKKLRQVCEDAKEGFYSRFKDWADNYFYLRHREETRGVGGIFFDRLDETSELDKTALFNFVLNVGHSFLPIYSEQFSENHLRDYSVRELSWRDYRRGRYVEFNLVWDRGTRFGLETGGRTESILMSLPANAQWIYDFKPEEDSAEQHTLDHLKKGINWVAIG